MKDYKLFVIAHVPIVFACILFLAWIASIYTGVETYRAFLWMLIGWLIYFAAIIFVVADSQPRDK